MSLINSNSAKQKQKIKLVLCHVGVMDEGASRNGEGERQGVGRGREGDVWQMKG